ncbi:MULTISPECIES: DUF58 domain-containing protein [unclassified Paracoccus (in: a-proteobacteria)]|uniref:DUF58 domain-containing protein n=1 Tax=unclassified Paracoccus (in: a-proteobacteria) TaxID=2688777 RepID=UPI0021E10E4B|nr:MULTISPECIES: DUF58 domain-containing protein [unclassified Paracoccus (in: a-proteobacteria)]UXU73920.1 DUF58 domain-containing protein [Paracoccus sp. SMMA_5]UXU79807.1 DUF58 domain-containing protein [Paracoccus sp. SMMA_5_TC]
MTPTTPELLRADASAALAGLPALMLSAQRLAAALVPGSHGQRRAGSGEDFWQYRPAVAGDSARSIDWRRSARSDVHFVRDREAQLAQSAAIWVSGAAGMGYASAPALPTKRARADLLALALAMALLAGGERVALAGNLPRPGRAQAEQIARGLLADPLGGGDDDAPPAQSLRPGQRVVLFDDFLGDLQPVLDYLARAAALGVSGVMMQVLDPAEQDFPWSGAVLFSSASGALRHDTRDAAGLRAAYLARLGERRALLAQAAQTAGWHFGAHDSSQPAAQALLWLWSVLEG